MFDPIYFKKQFPLFDYSENASLVYLDNAATTQKPAVVIEAIADFYKRSNANANRSSHRLARVATEKINAAREKIAHFIGAESKEVVFTSGATESVNIIANGLSEYLNSGDEIVLSTAEHHANLVPWQELAKKTDAQLQFISADFSNWESVLSEKTKVMALTAVSNTLGSLGDLSFVKKIKKAMPELVVVIDASQLVAHRMIDVKAIACDFLVFSAHKMYGPSGVGALYGEVEKLTMLAPLRFGGEMIASVKPYSSEYVTGPERFEAGTSALASIAGFAAAVDFIRSQDRPLMEAYEERLKEYLYDKLTRFCADYPEFTLLSNKHDNVGIASISSTYYALADVAFWLDEHDIAVRVGDHCAQPLWSVLGIEGAVLRISLAAYNTMEDVDRLLSALRDFVKVNKEGENSEKNSFDLPFDSSELLSLNNWQRKYKKIVQWGKRYHVPYDIRQDEKLVSGCEVDLWLESKKDGESWFFSVDSDSDVVKGLALIIVEKINKKTEEEIRSIDFNAYFSELGLEKYLSPSRVNGLHALLEKISQTVS